MKIDSSNVLCLGGTTGIGLATPQLASSRGAQVTVVSNRREDVDNALDQLPAGTCGHAANLLDPQGRAELFDKGRHNRSPRVHGWTERQLYEDHRLHDASGKHDARAPGHLCPWRYEVGDPRRSYGRDRVCHLLYGVTSRRDTINDSTPETMSRKTHGQY
jgi:hypothetical protein